MVRVHLSKPLQLKLLKFVTRQVNPSGVPPHTAGIIPIPFNSKHFGHVVLYDFAGQHEYYSSHAAVMENLILPSCPLFLILIDISKPIEIVKEELLYWWMFIDNYCKELKEAIDFPHAILVGSQKDIVKSRGEDPYEKMVEIERYIRDIEVTNSIFYF